MLASAAGAVVAASIASLFGVKGTIIGVAIGSAAATFGTALAAHSLDRTHEVVRQVAVRAPEDSLLRRLGGTDTAGAVTESVPVANPGVTEQLSFGEVPTVASTMAQSEVTAATEAAAFTETEASPAVTAATDATTEMGASGPPTVVLPVGATEDAADAAKANAAKANAANSPKTSKRAMSWPALAGTIAIVFVIALVSVTAIELIAGKPLADIFGGHAKGGTTVQNVFGNSGPTTATTTTVPTTVPSTTTSTSTTGSTTTTSTTGGSTTTSTAVPTTTTTGVSTSPTTTATSSP
jgi:hypothetical protein